MSVPKSHKKTRAVVKTEILHESGKEKKFYETKEFKKLNLKWHRKLESKGFYDHEELDSPLELMKTNENDRFRIMYTGDQFISQQRYYELAGQLLHDHSFQNAVDENIWRLHAEGVSMKETKEKLKVPMKRVKELLASLQRKIIR